MSVVKAYSVRRGVLASCIAVQLAGCGLLDAFSDPDPDPEIAPMKRGFAAPTPSAVQAESPAEVLEALRARNRLTPDRRFIDALSRLPRFAGEAPGAAPKVTFEAGTWHVRIGESEVGVLRELPSFAEQYAIVLAQAAKAWKQDAPQPATPAATEAAPTAAGERPAERKDAEVAFNEPVATLRSIDERWARGEHGAADAHRAAQAYSALCLGMVDDLGVSDALFAQALAATAVAEALSGEIPAREKALLARLMGYGQSATALAEGLPGEDVVRQFIAREVEPLVASAQSRKDDTFTSMLALHVLVREADRSAVEAFLRRAPDALQGSFRALSIEEGHGFGPDDGWRMALSALIAMREALGKPVELGREHRYAGAGVRASAKVAAVASALGVSTEQVLPEAEHLLAELAMTSGGPWLPGDALAAYYKAPFFSALDRVVLFYVDRLGSPEQAQDVMATLGEGKGPLAQQFARYANDVARAEQRNLPLDELVKDIRELHELGIGAIDRLFDPIGEQGQLNSAQRRATTEIVARCDSRLSCRTLLSTIAYRNLQDLVSDEQLRLSVIAEAPREHGGLRLRHLKMERDAPAFLAALADPGIRPFVRAFELAYKTEWLDPAEVRRVFEALVAEAPTQLPVREKYATWLMEQKDYARAVELMDQWLALDQSDHVLRPLEARELRARALQKWGRVKEAWTTVEPLLSSMYGPALSRAAHVKAAAGEHAAALALARKAFDRYQTPAFLAILLEMLWRTDATPEAAALLEQWSKKLTLSDWSGPIARAFGQAYADRTDAGVKTFAELLTKNLDTQGIRYLAYMQKARPELAFRTYSQLKGAGYMRHYDASRAYHLMKEWKGRAEARTWIEQALPPVEREPLSQFAYYDDNFELIWELVPDPREDNERRSFSWLMRTMAYLRSEAPPAEWKPRLDQYYAVHREDFKDRMGLHLLGQIDQASVWAALPDRSERPLSTYVFGLKAQLDGDIAQAVDWYRITIEGGELNSGEVQWAITALERLSNDFKSLALLSKEAKAGKPASPEAGKPASP